MKEPLPKKRFCILCRQLRISASFTKTMFSGKRPICRQCQTARRVFIAAKRKASADSYAAKNPVSPRIAADMQQRRNYGITLEDKEALIREQRWCCACCGRRFASMGAMRPCTDHTVDPDGQTVVRGILCNICNTAIGMLGDNLEGIMKAARYLSTPREAFSDLAPADFGNGA